MISAAFSPHKVYFNDNLIQLLTFSCGISHNQPVEQFIDSGLLYRRASLHGLAGQYDNPMSELTLLTEFGTKNFSTKVLQNCTFTK